MRINEENFAAGNEEDIKPSYVEQVIYGHNVDDEAHPGIRKQISDTQAFYQTVKNSVQGVAEAAKESEQKAAQASEAVSGSVEEVKKAAADAGEYSRLAGEYASFVENALGSFPKIVDGEWWVVNWETGMMVPSGIMAEGHTPVKGEDYWTDEDKAEVKAYVDEAILGGAW